MAIPNWVYNDLVDIKLSKNGFYKMQAIEKVIEQVQKHYAIQIHDVKTRVDNEIKQIKAEAKWKISMYKGTKEFLQKNAELSSDANAIISKIEYNFKKYKQQAEADLKREMVDIVLKAKYPS